jgi:hypothetical protein
MLRSANRRLSSEMASSWQARSIAARENGKLRFQVPKIFSIWRGSRASRDKFLREAIKKEFLESPATQARMGRGGRLRASSFSADSQRWPLRAKALRFRPWL